MKTKGIILAGGLGTRLYPSTSVVSKQLQSVYDKPMIYYPISTLMLAGITDILIITAPNDLSNFERVIGNGRQWGLNIRYEIQFQPKGISDAFIIGEKFIGKDQVCLILGDNLFHGKLDFLRNAIETNVGGTIFGYEVNDPERYGVVEFDHEGNVLSIEEKPHTPKSNYAIPGLYVFNSDVVGIAKTIKPSARGELEITDVHNEYQRLGKLKVSKMGRGLTWLEHRAPESMLEASQFIHIVETRQSLKVACLEEIALNQRYITPREMKILLDEMPKSPYKRYCEKILTEYHDGQYNQILN